MTYGSVINSLAAGSKPKAPEIGMGVTFIHWSDRSPGTISDIISPKEILVQGDGYERIDTNGMSESQEYIYFLNPDAPEVAYTLRKNGRWVKKGDPMKNGQSIAVGFRERYYDYSF